MVDRNSSSVMLITTLATYQTVFWIEVGLKLQSYGQDVAFISFDDHSTALLKTRGFNTYVANSEDIVVDYNDLAFEEMLSDFGIVNTNYWFSHERITFGIHDEIVLRRKLMLYLTVADMACSTLLSSGRSVTMIQELGGFISVIASFFAAKKNEIDNWFVEPSFFKGRLFFLKNRFSALQLETHGYFNPSQEVVSYINKTLENNEIVIPQKDKHQYTSAFRKVVNYKNLKRLLEKLVDKHIHGKHFEFGYIGRHISVHWDMLVNSFRLRKSYTPLIDADKFVYYPLHVPADMALTLRSPEYLDQLALIDYLARTISHTHIIAIKEHPAMIGAINARLLLDLLSRYSNVVLLPPTTNNYEVIKAADAIISINSKSGAEGVLLGKPVFVLGDAFYRNAPMVTVVEHLVKLPNLLNDQIKNATVIQNKELVESYFENVWRHSYQGELYVVDVDNVDRFCISILDAIG